MLKLNFKNADLKIIDFNRENPTCKQKSIYLEIYPKNKRGYSIARSFGASKENPTIHLRDLFNITKERQLKVLLKLSEE